MQAIDGSILDNSTAIAVQPRLSRSQIHRERPGLRMSERSVTASIDCRRDTESSVHTESKDKRALKILSPPIALFPLFAVLLVFDRMCGEYGMTNVEHAIVDHISENEGARIEVTAIVDPTGENVGTDQQYIWVIDTQSPVIYNDYLGF